MGSRSGQSYPADSPSPEIRPRGTIREYAETILFCVLAILFIRAFVFQQSEIPSGSMEDTILIGDYVLVNRFLYAPVSFEWERRLLPSRRIRRGDVVVFKHPPQPEQDYIKRVLGLPGDTIAIRNGRLLVNDHPLEEAYVRPEYRSTGSFGPVVVRPGHYFLMGDHRNSSADSREWGQCPADLIKGRAFMILFSTDSPETAERAGQVTPISLVRKVYNLIFRSRWSRSFRSIH